MAEALARHFSQDFFEALSAGLAPFGSIPPFTFEALEEAGISTRGLRSKGFSEIRLEEIDYVVDLTRRKAARSMPASFTGKTIFFPVPDPFGHDLDAFRLARQRIVPFVGEELPRFVRRDRRFWWLHPKRLLASFRQE